MRENAEHTQDWKLSEDIKTGFIVPEIYFKGLEDDFLLNLSEKKLPKNNVFEIPKTYFEEFDDHIIEKIKSKKGKLINFKKIKLIPVAATVALIIFFGANFSFNNNSELSYDEIVNWVDVNINTISGDDIAFAFTDVNFDDMNPYFTIESEDIIESLINSDDIDFIIEEANINEIN
jgi:hypothetical protein